MVKTKSIGLFILSLLFQGISLSLQAYNNPYSIVYCPGDTSYYIANTGDHNILRRDASGNLSIFASSATDLDSTKGLCVWESPDLTDRYLYVTNSGKIHIYNINTGQQDSSIIISGALTLAGLVIDNSGTFLYAADYSTHKVYRVDRISRDDTIIINSGLFMPYALYLDPSVNRLVIASFDPFNATIMTFFISTGNLITSVPHPPKQLTGITRDGDGYWYVSSWATDKVYRYHPSLIPSPTEVIVPGGTIFGPTGVYCNSTGSPDILVIPSTFNHQVFFLPIITVGEQNISIVEDLINIHPNPGNRNSEVTITIPQSSHVQARLLDMRGIQLRWLYEGRLDKGAASFHLSAENLQAGTYLLEVIIEGIIYKEKWVLNP